MAERQRPLSARQREILTLIVRGNADGSFTDLDQILERASYQPTKAALQFTLRQLEERGLIEKKDPVSRRGAIRRVVAPTGAGLDLIRG